MILKWFCFGLFFVDFIEALSLLCLGPGFHRIVRRQLWGRDKLVEWCILLHRVYGGLGIIRWESAHRRRNRHVQKQPAAVVWYAQVADLAGFAPDDGHWPSLQRYAGNWLLTALGE